MVTLGYMRICMHAKSLQSCLTLYDPMDCTPPGSSVHEILQARILEWVAVPSSRRSPNPGVEPLCLCLLHWQTYSSWSHLGNPHVSNDTSGEGNGNLLQYFCLENHKGQELGGLPSMGSHRVGHDWSNLAAAAAMIPICYCQKFIATFTLKPFVIFCYWMKCLKCNISEPKKKKWICKRYRILIFWGENLCSWFSNSEWVW